MAEKEQEHLRIRLGARLLKKIDAAREKSGRTRTDEIEARLLQSFSRMDMEEMAQIAARETLHAVLERARLWAEASGQQVNFYEALMSKPKGNER